MTADRPKIRAVGYGNPPRHSRFKKGQSGNPRGRAKGSTSFSTILAKVLAQRVSLTLSRKRMRVTVRDALVLQLINGALSGNVHLIEILLANKLLDKTEPTIICISGPDRYV